MINMLPDYYFDLGVPFNADLQAIKRAYRAKAIVAHPDHGGSHEAMLRINEAYEILANPISRRHYDEARANQSNQKPNDRPRQMHRRHSNRPKNIRASGLILNPGWQRILRKLNTGNGAGSQRPAIVTVVFYSPSFGFVGVVLLQLCLLEAGFS